MYQLNGEGLVLAWLANEPSTEAREAMLEWLPKLAADPAGVAVATSFRPGVPAYVAEVPGTDAFVDYTVIDQYKTILILAVTTLRLDDLEEADPSTDVEDDDPQA